jgi:hypothetical protein
VSIDDEPVCYIATIRATQAQVDDICRRLIALGVANNHGTVAEYHTVTVALRHRKAVKRILDSINGVTTL